MGVLFALIVCPFHFRINALGKLEIALQIKSEG